MKSKRRYTVYQHPLKKDLQAVKKGLCWPALFFGWMWALSQKLYEYAFLLFLVPLGNVAFKRQGHEFTGFTFLIGVVCIFLRIFLLIRAEKLKKCRLENRGYTSLGEVEAKTAQKAIDWVRSQQKMIEAG